MGAPNGKMVALIGNHFNFCTFAHDTNKHFIVKRIVIYTIWNKRTS